MHSLIYTTAGAILLKKAAIPSGFVWIGSHVGPWTALAVFVLFLVLCPIAFRALLHWFEHQADDYAVTRVGPRTVVAALSWLRAALYGEKNAPWIEARIRRLKSLHDLTE